MGKLTKETFGRHCRRKQKSRTFEILAQVENIELDQVIAVGDGANDLPMLNIAD